MQDRMLRGRRRRIGLGLRRRVRRLLDATADLLDQIRAILTKLPDIRFKALVMSPPPSIEEGGDSHILGHAQPRIVVGTERLAPALEL